MELTTKQEDYLLEESRDKELQMDVLIEKDDMFEIFMDECKSNLEKEFSDLFECLIKDITNIYPNEWEAFCKDAFSDYIDDLRMEHI